MELVETYSSNQFARLLGYQGEMLVIEAFARAQFRLVARNTRSYNDRTWVASSHDLDFIYEKDAFAYGVEVKNSLGYMREDELDLKVQLCELLGITPLFVVRYMPKTWLYRVQQAGGYVLILKYQMYPLSHLELARAVREELGLPIQAPAALWDSTVHRFTSWHDRRVNPLVNSP
jgi:predicted RecB family endonuclease